MHVPALTFGEEIRFSCPYAFTRETLFLGKDYYIDFGVNEFSRLFRTI